MAKAKNVIVKNNQGYGYKYTDLAGVHEFLENTRQSYYQFIETVVTESGVHDYIMTQKLTIDDNGEAIKNGEPIRGARVVAAKLSGKENPAQEHGSALTYARRYSLYMAFGLATDDDDAEALTKPATPSTARKSKTVNFTEVRENIQNAESREEVENIFRTIPAPLQQYFIKDCDKRVKELEKGK